MTIVFLLLHNDRSRKNDTQQSNKRCIFFRSEIKDIIMQILTDIQNYFQENEILHDVSLIQYKTNYYQKPFYCKNNNCVFIMTQKLACHSHIC